MSSPSHRLNRSIAQSPKNVNTEIKKSLKKVFLSLNQRKYAGLLQLD